MGFAVWAAVFFIHAAIYTTRKEATTRPTSCKRKRNKLVEQNKPNLWLFEYPMRNKAAPETQAQMLGEDETVVSITALQLGQVRWVDVEPTGMTETIVLVWPSGPCECIIIWAAKSKEKLESFWESWTAFSTSL